MLYIFQVDSGCMMTFDMNLALDNVSQLKEAIERSYRIPAEKQVLLVSGGECLDPGARVCSYSAGTDTNPIYLFSKITLESNNPPSPSIDYGSDGDLKDQVDATLTMPPTYNTVYVRSQIAQKFWELAREQAHACEQLVHEQHLQQQGWAAAVANLEDVTSAFRNRMELFEQSYNQHLIGRDDSLLFLDNFSEDLLTLSKIPILPPLLETAWSFSSGEGAKESTEGKPSEEQPQELGGMSLLQWISAADNRNTLEQVAELCSCGLKQFNEETLELLRREVQESLDTAANTELKEIKGLEERLFGLEQLMCETKKIVQEQSDLAQSFLQNQNRASNLGDTSILPDLCASHRKQLLVMSQNQHKLRDIRRRCTKAKEELSVNLYHRLRWVIYVENKIGDVSNKLMIYNDNLKRLRKYLDIIKQVQKAPQMYVTAVGEVVRRRTFSQAYINWASDLSCRLLTICNEECERRRDFHSQFEGHFLQSLFPGFDDVPPTFATQAPPPFDTLLPKLTAKDMEQLNVQLPDLDLNMSITKLSSNAQMFLIKSVSDTSKEGLPVEEKLVKVMSEVGLSSKLDQTLLQPDCRTTKSMSSHLHKDDRDFESETDTEEFEKVCQSPVDMTFENKSEGDGSGGTKTEGEVDNLKRRLSAAGKLANDTAMYLRTELCKIKTKSLSDGEIISNLVEDIKQQVILLSVGYNYECEALGKKIESITQTTGEEINTLKQFVQEKEETISDLERNLSEVRVTISQLEEKNTELSSSLVKCTDECEELKEKLKTECDVVERLTTESNELVNRLNKELDVEQEDKRKALENINVLQQELVRTQLDAEVEREKLTTEHTSAVHELNVKLGEERDKLIREAVDKVVLEHKTELENLRSRYRLMSAASMEKSPSDSSLEKIERFDVIELANHEAIISQLKEDMKLQRDEAVRCVNEDCRKKIEEELQVGRRRMEEEKQVWLQEAVTRALADKDRYIESLLSRQENLMTECHRHRDTIRLLTDGDHVRVGSSPGAGTVDPLLDRIDMLEKEKLTLRHELERERKRSVVKDVRQGDDMSCSVAVVPAVDVLSHDVSTSPEHSKRPDSTTKDKLTKSTTTLIQQAKISITSCSPGDAVLVVWDIEHANYTILQETATSTLYFLHSDCFDVLGLKPSSDGSPRRLYSTALVVDKEYCHAKKAENRYRVPKGTKFYRVKVKPFPRDSKESSLTRSHHSSRQQTSTICPHHSADSALSLPSSISETTSGVGGVGGGEDVGAASQETI